MYAPMNNKNGLSVTKDGNLVFSKKDSKVFVITSPDDPKQKVVLCKYRMIYDIFLLYESHGYSIEEYFFDDCPASTCIPCRPKYNRAKRPVLEDERVEEVLARQRPQRSRSKLKKSQEYRDHPLQAHCRRKLESRREYNASRHKRDKYRRYDRAYKHGESSVWNITEEVLESDTRLRIFYDYGEPFFFDYDSDPGHWWNQEWHNDGEDDDNEVNEWQVENPGEEPPGIEIHTDNDVVHTEQGDSSEEVGYIEVALDLAVLVPDGIEEYSMSDYDFD